MHRQHDHLEYSSIDTMYSGSMPICSTELQVVNNAAIYIPCSCISALFLSCLMSSSSREAETVRKEVRKQATNCVLTLKVQSSILPFSAECRGFSPISSLFVSRWSFTSRSYGARHLGIDSRVIYHSSMATLKDAVRNSVLGKGCWHVVLYNQSNTLLPSVLLKQCCWLAGVVHGSVLVALLISTRFFLKRLHLQHSLHAFTKKQLCGVQSLQTCLTQL